MNFFEEATLRLKQLLKVTEDKQVAEALGMTGNAWTMRKRRSAFPETELYALAAKRPELGIDVAYVLTGEPLTERQAHAGKLMREVLSKAPQNEKIQELLEQIGLAEKGMGEVSARRKKDYTDIVELLNDCTDDTVGLIIQTIIRYRHYDVTQAGQRKPLR